MTTAHTALHTALALVALVVLAVASCKSTEPTAETAASEGVSDAVKAECRRWASVRAEREYAQTQPDIGTTYGRQITLRDNFETFDAQKRREQLYRRCLAEMGAEMGGSGNSSQ